MSRMCTHSIRYFQDAKCRHILDFALWAVQPLLSQVLRQTLAGANIEYCRQKFGTVLTFCLSSGKLDPELFPSMNSRVTNEQPSEVRRMQPMQSVFMPFDSTTCTSSNVTTYQVLFSIGRSLSSWLGVRHTRSRCVWL